MYGSLVIRSTLRVLVLACFLAAAFASGLGCDRQVAPPLVDVAEVAPREVESGDRLEIHGSGFPQGRSARVTFEGTLFRPGAEPLGGVTIEADGVTTASDRVEVVVRESITERFCGRGDAAAHATFRGEVRIGFASSNIGAPPLVGRLREATLDVLPVSVRGAVRDARLAEGARVLAYLGITSGTPTARGLPVEQVRPSSLAEHAGIQVGDVVTSIDGVSALSTADVLPVSARTTELTIRRADSGAEETKTLSMADYAAGRVPSEFVPALLVVGLALVLLVLLMLPGPASLVVFELEIARRLRGTSLRAAAAGLFGRGRLALVSVIASAVIVAFALVPYVVGRELDVVLFLAFAASMLVWSRVALEQGAFASLRTLFRLAFAALVMVAAIVIALLQLGAIELGEIVRFQGGAPWEFHAARHPACAVAFVAFIAAVVSVMRVRPDVTATKRNTVLSQTVERIGLLFASALGVTVFLGGWQLPGLTEPKTRLLVLLAAVFFVAKTWLVAGLALAASRLATRITPVELVFVVLKRLIPALLAAGVLTALSRRIVPSIAVETAFGGTLAALVALFAARLAARVRGALARPEPHASPFL